ncbi:hypothetical protein HPC49_21625 [Pyxidicoccus fallax]|uniref:Immunity MXAN-0049 protein domain-containing protein n=1 Tax=Pyxidicoccus fallax TaxID=394095 RepID=A0A848LD47_9BACT|nr:DUF1629 domain-containing protein [Pyxidicoccus fallax]NMO16617.1 hypothetical protein [Pyxidicoccus fallax]NPC80812.1 hypothetical protein [Pyxidicoccus fallax]
MATRYFDLKIDVDVKGRWYLGDPMDLSGREIDDIWQFIDGRKVEDPGPLRIPLYRPGRPLDIEFAGAGQAPILSSRAAAVFRELAADDVQLFPAEVEGQSEAFYLLNVARTARCIDDAACEEARLYTAADDAPDKIGRYHVVSGLRIDKSKVRYERVFRLWGWSSPIIVDESIKAALEQVGIVGGRFDEV